MLSIKLTIVFANIATILLSLAYTIIIHEQKIPMGYSRYSLFSLVLVVSASSDRRNKGIVCML